MIFIFPLLGAVFSALTVWLRGFSGTDILFEGLFYFFDYTLLLALCYVAFLVVLALLVDLKKQKMSFYSFLSKTE